MSVTGRFPLRQLSAILAAFVLGLLALCVPARAQSATPAPAAAPTASPAPVTLHLSANSVRFYYDRFLLEADGNVHVTTSDGITMTGDALSMDLKLNRFVLAGHVHVASPAGSQDGAALADFLDFNRIYFVPITGEPDRWTFVNGDFAHPAKGRIMPGDTFFLPDLGTAKPFLTSTSAVVESRNYIRFPSSRVDMAGGTGLYVWFPSYYVNFSTDRHLAENSLSGATVDATYEFAGNANYISAAHIRYDPTNKLYGSFEQHLATQKAYAVFSVNPLTRPSKFWNLILSDEPSDRLQIRTFSQLHTFQYGLSTPLESSQFTDAQVTNAFKHESLQLATLFTNQSLLAPPANGLNYIGSPQYPYNPDHSTFTILGVNSYEINANKPVRFTYRYGIGFNDDGYQPLQNFGGTSYRSIWDHYLGFTAYTPSFDLSHHGADKTVKDLYLNAVFDKQRTWYSVPHHIDMTNTTLSVSRIMDGIKQHVTSYLQYNVDNIGDYYGAAQRAVYPVITSANGVSDPGYAAFRGFATYRTLSLGAIYSNAGDFSFSLLARKHEDFPKPVPGFFIPPVQTDVFGRLIYSPYFGQPPYDLTGDVRFRVSANMEIDVARTYFFNFNHIGWGSTIVQVTQ